METAIGSQHDKIILIPQPSRHPRDPLNWSLSKKYSTMAVVCFSAFAATLNPTSHQLAYVLQAPLYHRSVTELSYTATVAVAGLFTGPLLLTPLARVIGRGSIIFWSLLAALACQIWAACMTDQNDFVPFTLSRLLCGIFAAMPTIFGPSYATDMFFLHQRGKAFISYELSLIGGVVASPTIGGFIVDSKPWPYTFWWTIAPVGTAVILVFCFLEETSFRRGENDEVYPELSEGFLRNRIATFFPGNEVTPRTCAQEVIKSATAPFVIATVPIVMITGFYAFVAFGFSIMINIVLTIFLQTPETEGGYGFSPLQNAAFTFNAWVGIIAAQAIGWSVGDAIPLWASRRFGQGIWHLEYRLWNMLLPAVVSPIGLGIFGAGLQYHLHFMVLALGLFLVVFAATLSVPICINYVTECFLTSVNEVAITMNMYRLGFSIALGFFVFPWVATVGAGWLFGMAAFFNIFAAFLIALLAWRGQRFRRLTPKGLLATEDGEKVNVLAGGVLGGPEEIHVEAVHDHSNASN